MEKIILCKCFFGGYDLCNECAGSGVIISHEESDYKPIIKSKQTVLTNTPGVRSQLEKIKKQIEIDNDKFWAIIKNFKKLISKKSKVIDNLNDSVKLWKSSLVQIKDNDLKTEVENYIKRMQTEINIVAKEFNEYKKRTTQKNEESISHNPKTAWRRGRNKRKK